MQTSTFTLPTFRNQLRCQCCCMLNDLAITGPGAGADGSLKPVVSVIRLSGMLICKATGNLIELKSAGVGKMEFSCPAQSGGAERIRFGRHQLAVG